MKRVLHASILILVSLLSSVLFVSAQFTTYGSIRGTFYLDNDGNGICGASDARVDDFFIQFANEGTGTFVQLYSGNDGTYGLVGAPVGDWVVTAVPPASNYSVTSQNPIELTITEEELVITDVDFCVRSDGLVVEEDEESDKDAPKFLYASTTSTFSGKAPPIDVESNYQISQLLISETIPGPDYDDIEEYVGDDTGDVSLPENQPDWLAYLNQIREAAGVPFVTAQAALTQGSNNHARFMVVNDLCCGHSENPANPLFTITGNSSGVNGNIFSSTWSGSEMKHAMNFWVSAPFHLIGMIDPALTEVGYGEYRQDVGVFHYASVLDVRSNEVDSVDVPDSTYPIYYPKDGSTTSIIRRSLPEWPDPLTHPSCANYAIPTGPALILMIGDGDQTPVVSEQKVYADDVLIESCYFTETTYQNPDSYAQQTGRIVLGTRDAVVITPRYPLAGGKTYRVEVMVNDELHSWSFETGLAKGRGSD